MTSCITSYGNGHIQPHECIHPGTTTPQLPSLHNCPHSNAPDTKKRGELEALPEGEIEFRVTGLRPAKLLVGGGKQSLEIRLAVDLGAPRS